MKKGSTVRRNRLGYDILQLFLVLLALALLVSLLTYSKDDPSFSNLVFSKYEEVTVNQFGKLGAYLSDILGTAFGWTALFIPPFLIYLAVIVRRYRLMLVSFISPFVVFIFALVFILSFSAISGIIGGYDIYFTTKKAGGVIGLITSSFIVSLVGNVGGIIISTFLILLSVMILFSISLSDIGRFAKSFYEYMKRRVNKLFNFKEEPALVTSYVGEVEVAPENKEPENNLDDGMVSVLTEEEKKEVINIFGDEKDIQEKDVVDVKEEEPKPKEKEIIKVAVKEEEPIFRILEAPKVPAIQVEEPIEIKPISKVQKSIFSNYNIPMSILTEPDRGVKSDSQSDLKAKADLLVQKLNDFGVTGVVRAIQPGPVVTMFEYEPASGVRISKIAMLENDLALNMSALSIRIIAPIPGKNAVGIEIPNENRANVCIKEILQTQDFAKSISPLTIALGKDVTGKPYLSDLRKMPHLLVAGTTGSGKSVGVNSMICSILFKSTPEEVRFIMIDPKMVELSIYEGIPHLLAPVVTDPRLAASVLKNVVTEMTRRYTLLSEHKVRNIESYNDIAAKDVSLEKMFYLVVVVDEFADLMMVAGKEVEISITRIAQMARAVGIHLVIATQRPTTNVITGLIKSNMPARLSFKVSQRNDSRVILDQNGADTLLGRGDSLFIVPGTSDPIRIHGAFVSDEEVRNIVEHLKQYGEPDYDMTMVKEEAGTNNNDDGDDDVDERYDEALSVVYEKGSASISMIQRQLKIGYNRAARIVELMEKRGIISASDGTAKPREILKY